MDSAMLSARSRAFFQAVSPRHLRRDRRSLSYLKYLIDALARRLPPLMVSVRIQPTSSAQSRRLWRDRQLVSGVVQGNAHIIRHKLTLRGSWELLLAMAAGGGDIVSLCFSVVPCHHAIAERIRVTGAARLWDGTGCD